MVNLLDLRLRKPLLGPKLIRELDSSPADSHPTDYLLTFKPPPLSEMDGRFHGEETRSEDVSD